MAHRSEPRFLVLHGLRLKGFAATTTLANSAGLAPEVAEGHLRALAEEGSVRHHEGRPAPWSLTPAGRAEHRRLAGDELDASGATSLVEDAYGRFRSLNPELLLLCTEWQLRPDGEVQVINDHSDEA